MFAWPFLTGGVILLFLAIHFACLAMSFGMKSDKEVERGDGGNIGDKNPLAVAGRLNLFHEVAALLSGLFFLLSVLLFASMGFLDVLFQSVSGKLLLCAAFVLLVWITIGAALVKGSRHKKKTTSSHRLSLSARIVFKLCALLRPLSPNKETERGESGELLCDDVENTEKNATMLKGILQFGNEIVRDIMTQRVDVLDLDVKAPFSEVLRIISENSYSRIPVYSGMKDNIIGILYIKDLLPYLNKPPKFRWSFLIRQQFSVPETKKIDNLLREFQKRKIHLAVVIDEYGGVSGIVTLEDIIEEIVGEINDEYDDDHSPYVSLDRNTYIFDTKMSLQNFSKMFNLESAFFDEVEGDADTIAGLLLDLFGDLPKKHQNISFHQFKFEILQVDERRISKVKVTIAKQEVL